MTPTSLEVARELTLGGWRVVPVPHRSKAPILEGWQRLRLGEAELEHHFDGVQRNVGALLGEASADRVDVDLDCAEAVALGPLFLPHTATFGRPGKPRSHYLYRTKVKTAKFQDPVKNLDNKKAMLVELRSTGCQTIMPGSTHESGEVVAWDGPDRVAVAVEPEELRARVGELASASLLARHWPSVGARHDAALHLSGALVRSGWDAERVAMFVRAVCSVAGCSDLDNHTRAARDTAGSYSNGHGVTGWAALADTIPHGAEVVPIVRKWLGVRDVRIPRAVEGVDPPASAPERAYEMTDLGNAERMAERHGLNLRYVHAWSKWLVWRGTHWAPDESAEVDRYAQETVRSIYRQAADLANQDSRGRLVQHARNSESRARLSAMIALAATQVGIPIGVDELDRDEWLLPLQNGTLDLQSGALRPHRREDLCTRFLPIAWDESAVCPTWERFLFDIANGNEALVAFLRRAVGYTLTASTREQVLFFCLGVGSNGKSTFLRTLQSLLGDFACQAAPDLLLAKKGEAHPTEQADLFGKRLAVCTEIGAGRAFAEVTVKQLTGGDPIKARRMREDFWQFDPTHKFWIAANHKPIVRGTDHAIWRRLLLVPFNVVFAENKKDPTLPEKIRAELAGILRWAVAGCKDWLDQGLSPPPEVLAAVAKYREEMDVIGAFLRERVVSDGRSQLGAAQLFARYLEWCEANGERPVKQRAFGQAMTERGYERIKKSHAVYVGIRFRDERDDPDDLSGSPEDRQRSSADADSSSQSSRSSRWKRAEPVEISATSHARASWGDA